MQPNNQTPGFGGDPQDTQRQDETDNPEKFEQSQAVQSWPANNNQPLDGPPSNQRDWQTDTPSQSLESPQPETAVWSEHEQATVATDVLSQQPIAKRPSRKALFISLAAVILFLLTSSAVFVFGFYLPNTPERVWRTGMDRTGGQMTAIVEAFQDPEALETFDKTEATLTGTVTGTSGGEDYNFELNVDSLSDDTASQSTAGFKMDSGENKYDVSAEIRTALPEEAIFPNVYFKLSGLSSLNLDEYIPEISKLDNQWIAIEQEFIEERFTDQLGAMRESPDSDREGLGDITNDDIVSIVADVNEVTQEYVFTSDPEKAVIIMDTFVATEQSEGVTANHYKAKINKNNATTYCAAIVDKLSANDGLKKFYSDDEAFTDAMEEAKDECDESDPDFDWDQTFDVWIDKKNKIFHKIRVYEDLEKENQEILELRADCVEMYQGSAYYSEERISGICDRYDDMIVSGESYYEVGQVYEGGSRFVLFNNFVTDTNKSNSNGRVDMQIDAATLAIGGSVNYTSSNPDDDDSMELKATITTEPYAGDIDSSKPKEAMSIQEAMDLVY